MQERIERAAQAVRTSCKTIALTGAGISAESGIPTFRDPGGLWDRYDPEEYATIDAFRRDPGKVWQMMRDFTELKTAQPSPGHSALAQLEQMGLLGCIITQNVDNLHQDLWGLGFAKDIVVVTESDLREQAENPSLVIKEALEAVYQSRGFPFRYIHDLEELGIGNYSVNFAPAIQGSGGKRSSR